MIIISKHVILKISTLSEMLYIFYGRVSNTIKSFLEVSYMLWCDFFIIHREDGCSACTLCPHGNYSNKPGSAKCPPCQPGSYSNVSGSTSCIGCEAGHYSNRSGSAVCFPCVAGTHQPNRNQTTCLPCEAGHETRYGSFYRVGFY